MDVQSVIPCLLGATHENQLKTSHCVSATMLNFNLACNCLNNILILDFCLSEFAGQTLGFKRGKSNLYRLILSL